MISSLSLLNSEELASLPRELTLFLFPVGGLEQHGPHLPMGVKLVEAETLTKAMAEELHRRLPQWSFVLMPLIPLTVDGVTNRMALPVRPHVVRDAVVDQCEQLKRLGFKNFIVVNSHLTPRQITALEDASRIVSGRLSFFRRKAQLVSITGALVSAKMVFDSPMIALPEEHGGRRDTSWMLAHAPERVSPNYANFISQPKPKASVSRFFSFLSHEIDGYWGDPANASVEEATRTLSQDVVYLSEKLIPWLEKGQGKRQFLSPYRFFPFNGSFFKVYVLAGMFFILMILWTLWSVRDVFEP